MTTRLPGGSLKGFFNPALQSICCLDLDPVKETYLWLSCFKSLTSRHVFQSPRLVVFQVYAEQLLLTNALNDILSLYVHFHYETSRISVF